MKCDMCGKEEGVETVYVSSWERSTYNEKILWEARESGEGFEGWVIVGAVCSKLLISIADRNSMKVKV